MPDLTFYVIEQKIKPLRAETTRVLASNVIIAITSSSLARRVLESGPTFESRR